MTLQQYLRGLMTEERDLVATQTGSSKTYLRILASDSKRKGSVELAKRILDCEANKALDSAFQFTEKDFIAHRKAAMKERVKK